MLYDPNIDPITHREPLFWTSDRLNKLINRRQNGWSVERIAKAFHVARSVVRAKIAELDDKKVPGMGMKPTRDWPEEAHAMLVQLWADGLTTSQISKALTEAGHPYSRNAVIGRAHRQKLPPRPSPLAPGNSPFIEMHSKRRAEKIAATKSKPVPRPNLGAPPASQPLPEVIIKGDAWKPLPGSKPVTLLERMPHRCAWPVGENPIVFCGLLVDGKGSWCPKHRRRGFHPNPRKVTTP